MNKIYLHIQRCLFVLAGLLFLLPNQQVRAQVSIGTTGTLSSYYFGPIYRSSTSSAFQYSKYAYLYTATEIAAAGINNGDQISAISFYKNSTFQLSGTNSGTMKIYANNTTNTALTTGTTWGAFVGTATLVDSIVYNSTSNIPGSVGWITYNFTSPITYTGGALEVYVDWALSPTASPYSGGAFNWLYASGYSTNLTLGTASSTALNGSSALVAVTYGGTLRPNTQLTSTPGSACAGQPTSGTLNGPTSVCPNITFNLTTTGSSIGSGMTYQWQSSPTGAAGSWTNITGKTGSAYSGSQTATTYYRRYMICSNSSLADTTASKQITINPVSACYCTPTTTGGTSYYITGVSTTNAATNLSYTSSSGSAGYKDLTVTQPALVVIPGSPFNYSINVAGGSTYGLGVWIDTNMDGTFQTTEQFASTGYLSPPITGAVSIPATARTGITRMRVLAAYTPSNPTDPCVNSGSGEYNDFSINIYAPPACSGTPTAGTAYGPAAVCANSSFTIKDTAFTIAGSISYQWQSSPAGAGTWSPISNATTANYIVTAGITTATDYRFVVTCSNGGGQDISNVISIGVNPFYNCYCIPASACTNEGITNVTMGTLNNTSGYCASTSGFSDYKGLGSLTTISQGTSTPISVTARINDNNSALGVWIDYDGNGVFDTTEFTLLGVAPNMTYPATYTYSGSIAVPPTATLGVTGMRVRESNGGGVAKTSACTNSGVYGEYEDYLITIGAGTPCAGTPTAGTVSGPSTICPSLSFAISASGFSSGATGLSYQWQSNTGSGWQSISGATNTTYAANTGITIPTSYRFYISCASGGGDTSNIVAVGVSTWSSCYCIPSTTDGTTYYITNVTTTGAATNINNSTSSGNASGYHDYSGNVPIVVFPGTSFNYSINIAGSSNYGMGIWIDTNMDGTFQATEQFLTTSTYVYPPVTGSISIPLSARIGTTRMRILAAFTPGNPTNPCSNSGNGDYQDYSISIAMPTPCSGTPVAGTATVNMDTLCVSGNVKLAATGYSSGNAGIQLNWQSSPAGANSFTDILNATFDTMTAANITSNTDYRLRVTCTNGGGTAYSNIKTIIVKNPSVAQTIPGSRCGTGNVTLLAVGANGANIKWYDAATAGTLQGNGNAFTTPSLSTTTTYYAAANTGSGMENMPTPTAGTSTFYTSTVGWGLRFTVNNPATINSVVMYPSNTTAGAATLQVKVTDLSDVVLFSGPVYSFNVGTTSAAVTVPVNITVPPGNYKMVMSATGVGNLVRESGGVTFPYTALSNAISITAGANGAGTAQTTSAYYWFYAWNISVGCEGTRVPVTATVNAAATGTGLAAGGTTVGNAQTNGTTVAYTSSCNDTVAVINSGATNIGNTSAIVLTSPTVQTLGNKPFVPRAYDITPTTNGPATVTLYVLQSEFNAYNAWVTANAPTMPLLPNSATDVTKIPNIVVTQYHGSASAGNKGPLGLYANTNIDFIPNSSITVTPMSNYWKLTFPVTGFSGFFIHSGTTPLAIDLKTITATNVGTRNRVDWTTGTEKAGDAFEVERSVDGRNFTYLASIKGKGEASTYSYWDQSPVTGVNYYRLKLVNVSGVNSYSNVVTATVKSGSFTVEAYPNPVSQLLTVKAYGATGNGSVTITDATGKLVRVVNMDNGQVQINMEGLAQGMYLLKYADDQHTEVIKVNKQ
ncbi:MAG: T9SS type A sorting domain-containing protein [Bacteroidetes bacterium]|nr:T9SS type A sorting domain-containing protein [Bacteroidota bacterium]